MCKICDERGVPEGEHKTLMNDQELERTERYELQINELVGRLAAELPNNVPDAVVRHDNRNLRLTILTTLAARLQAKAVVDFYEHVAEENPGVPSVMALASTVAQIDNSTRERLAGHMAWLATQQDNSVPTSRQLKQFVENGPPSGATMH